jgi:FHS family L-fucose permease-like MFS transporter
MNQVRNYAAPIAILYILFFMWGFVTALNDILVPHLKGLFELNYTQATLVQFCFFGAYFTMSFPASWLIDKIGYKRSAVVGLGLMGLGCALFYPASVVVWYPLFLFALFVLASGMTVLQVTANPYVVALGKPETGSSRLNLAQGFNSLAHTTAPLFGTLLILSPAALGQASKAEAVQVPYVGLAIFLCILAIFFARARLPTIETRQEERAAGDSILNHRHLLFGALAIFMYVGAEVSIGSFLVNFFGEKHIMNMPEEVAGNYVSYYWGSAMVGRFVGALLQRFIKPQLVLAFCCVGTISLVITTVVSSGEVAMWSILLVGFFNSVMFPTIFSLSIFGLGKLTSRASGLLVMMIFGGAFIPVLQGILADNIGIHRSFLITVACYAYVMWFAWRGYRPVSGGQ